MSKQHADLPTNLCNLDTWTLVSNTIQMTIHVVNVTYTVLSAILICLAILICISMTVVALRPVSWSDPLDLAELHNFRLVYFKHKEIFLVVCIVSR